MNKVLVIARREYTEVLRTKMFWISMLLPVVIIVISLVLGMRHGGPRSAEDARMIGMMGAFMYVLVLFMSILPTSQMLLTSLIEEKSSRVIEVLLSAVSPFELMAGKLLGLICVGLTSGAVFIAILSIGAGGSGVLKAPSPALLALLVVYYVLGFVMYSSVYLGVGAAFNTLKDAQTVMIPLSFLLVMPIMFWVKIAQNPTAGYSVALSIFPPTAPMVMIMRVAVLPEPPWLEVAASLALLAASVPLIVWAAARIFRTGVLLYGKPPKLAEILRWVRSS